jgi:Tfp pilus assembly protein PilN
MSDREYLDHRFEELNKNIKWFIGIAVTVFIAILGLFGTIMLSNRSQIKEMQFDIVLLDTTTEDIRNKQNWLAELNEMQRDILKAYSNNEDLTEYLEGFERMERRVIAGSKSMPTLRSLKRVYKN